MHHFIIWLNYPIVIWLFSRRVTRNFSLQGRFLKKGHFDKHLIYNIQKKDTAGKNFGDFFPRDAYNSILNEKLNPWMNLVRTFLPKIRTLFFKFWKFCNFLNRSTCFKQTIFHSSLNCHSLQKGRNWLYMKK